MLPAVRIVIDDTRCHAVLVGCDLAHPAVGAQLNSGALRRGPVGNVGARLGPLGATGCAMAEINAARPSLVINRRDGCVGWPPVPAELVYRASQQGAGPAEWQRRHRR